MARTRNTLAGAVVAILVLGGCGEDEEAEEPASPRSAPATEAAAAADDATTVTIEDFTYAPVPLRVQAGTSITVENNDETAHTLTADDGSIDTGAIEGGASAEVEVTDAGRIEYHCEIHPSMKGVIETGRAADAEQPEPEQTDPGPAPGY